VLEVMRSMLEAKEGEVCLLEVEEVKVEVMRRVRLYMLEVVEHRFRSLGVLSR
jgi:hypothetical protein